MNSNVEFFEKMKNLKDIQYSNEETRIELEQQLNTYIRSDKRVAKLKAVRLQSYWKKICEDEKKSQWRNEQLMRDFERVESHMEDLHARTEKLRMMKKKFEDHVENLYPNWKEKVLYYKQLKEHQENLDRNREAEEIRKATLNEINAQSIRPTSISYPQTSTGFSSSQPAYPLNSSHPVNPPHSKNVPLAHSSVGAHHVESELLTPSKNRESPRVENIGVGSTMSSLQTGTGGLSTGFSGNSMQATSTPHPGHEVQVKDTSYSRIEEESTHRSNPQQSSQVLEDRIVRSHVVSPVTQSYQHVTSESRESTQTTQITQKQVNTFMEPHEEKEVSNYRSSSKSRTPRSPKHKEDKTEDLEEGDLGSVEELPQSVSETPRVVVHGPTSGTKSPIHYGNEFYADPEVTISGLYSILSAVCEHMDSASARHLYRGDKPAPSVYAEIIENANRGSALNYMDCTSLSMVVLDQLPLLVASTQDQFILPDSILFKFPPVISESTIREKVPMTSRVFWDKLLEHFVLLAKYKVMKTQEIAEIFAPLIISLESPYENKAVELVCTLLDECVPEDFASPNSTSTFSATPRPKPQVLQQTHDSDEDDEDFFEKAAPREEMMSGKLTQSAAYRQMLGSTVSTHKSLSYIDSDEEDDIEKQVASPRPVTAKGSFKKSSGTVSPKVPVSPSRDGALSPASRDGALSPASLSSAPPASPRGLGGIAGYVPSSLGDTGRSGIGQSTLSSMGSTGKKPAFMYGGNSDTDEDIDLPGADDQRHEDYDFYD